MHSKLNWLGENQEIAMIESHGIWDSLELLQLGSEILSVSPRYIVWNPTNVIFLAENTVTNLEENAPQRFKIFGVVSEVLGRDKKARLIIITRNHNPVFDALQSVYESQGKGHQLIFCKSLDDAMNLIEEQNHSQ